MLDAPLAGTHIVSHDVVVEVLEIEICRNYTYAVNGFSPMTVGSIRTFGIHLVKRIRLTHQLSGTDICHMHFQFVCPMGIFRHVGVVKPLAERFSRGTECAGSKDLPVFNVIGGRPIVIEIKGGPVRACALKIANVCPIECQIAVVASCLGQDKEIVLHGELGTGRSIPEIEQWRSGTNSIEIDKRIVFFRDVVFIGRIRPSEISTVSCHQRTERRIKESVVPQHQMPKKIAFCLFGDEKTKPYPPPLMS